MTASLLKSLDSSQYSGQSQPADWTVSTRPIISKSSSPCTNPLVTVSRAPIRVSIILTFMFHRFFSITWQVWGTYLSFCILSILLCGPPGQQCPQSFKFSLFLLIIKRSYRLTEIRRYVCFSKSQRSHLQRRFGIYHLFAWSNFKLLAQLTVDHLEHPVLPSLVLFLCYFAGLAYYVMDYFVSIIT